MKVNTCRKCLFTLETEEILHVCLTWWHFVCCLNLKCTMTRQTFTTFR